MKKFIFILTLFILPATHFAQVGEWTWMNGNNTLTSSGVFGTQGVFAAANTPPGLYEACEWTDIQGNFWLFGGVQGGEFNTLWKYDVALNQWAWIRGSSSINGIASYGTMGVPSPTNNPGHRGWGTMTWTDKLGKLWLFGGYGGDVNNFSGGLNDLWKYDPTTNEWTWMHGANTANQVGNYGTMGVPAVTNDPPDRQENNASWTDSQGNLWLYGGLSSTSNTGNDLWMFNTSTNMWTWIWGSQIQTNPTYGTKGVEVATNDPGSRFCYTKFVDSFDNLYLFGAASGFTGTNISDVWRYKISSGMWTWIGGTNTPNEPGNYSGYCDTNALDVPRSKIEIRASWPDSCGFWLFGGFDSDAANDLWYYNLYNNKFTWVTGSSSTGALPNYGTITVSAPTNDPGGRGGALSWKDNAGNLWLFGGYAVGFAGQLNDLWRFVPDTSCVELCKFTNAPPPPPPPPPIPEELYIPNVFSPNGDSINDLFEITALGFKDYKLRIYNRWGSIVFESNDHLMHWNGKIEGSKDEASDGTYYYVLRLVNNADQEISYKGFLTLLRNK